MKNIINLFFCTLLVVNMLGGCSREFVSSDSDTENSPHSVVQENHTAKTLSDLLLPESPSQEIMPDDLPLSEIQFSDSEELSRDTTTNDTPSDTVLPEPPSSEYEESYYESSNQTMTDISPSPEVSSPVPEESPEKTTTQDSLPVVPNGKIIVIDPGHGKSSSLMSEQEKNDFGYTYVQGKGWGEWRHFKSGTMWEDCEGYGCSGRTPENGSCWYPIGASNRATEPDLNYNNAVNAKKYLEQLGYTVRITRGPEDSPSITQRIRKCYPNDDISLEPDASAYVCIHSNAGGGRGSCYISLSGLYDQGDIPENYVEVGNALGKSINDCITQKTSMPKWSSGEYTGYPELVLFCKSPVPVAYLEIGFYDNAFDLNILQQESDSIGKAIAEGIDAYFNR